MIILSSKDDRKSLETVADVFQKAKTVVYPTETAYGLGADALNPVAIARIFSIKGRSEKKPLPVIVSSLSMAKDFFRFESLSLDLAKKYWPGPLTILLKPKEKFKDSQWFQLLSAGTGKVGVRVSSHPIASGLSRRLSSPIVSTSANISGSGECYSVKEILRQFKWKNSQPDVVLDFGRILKRIPSTVVDIRDGELVILRQGAIKI